MRRILFFPITFKQIQRMFRPFTRYTRYFTSLFYSDLESDLDQAEIESSPESYFAGAVFSATVVFLILLTILIGLVAVAKPAMMTPFNLAIIFVVCVLITIMVYFYAMFFPNWKAKQRAAKLEKDLLFAIRHLTVQTNAGVPLFAAMVSVAEERGQLGYGAVSEEFGRIVKEVEGGSDLSDALENSSTRVKSKYYERIMWQLANSNRAGVPVNEALSSLLDYLSDEQRISLRKYGAELNPLALMYLLVTIIGPTLGLVFLMIASTLIFLPASNYLLDAIIAVVLVVQIFFLGLVQSRRPTMAM